MRYTLGIDLGSSSVKVSLLDVDTGNCAGSCTEPESEMGIASPRPGFAEQSPAVWYGNTCKAIRRVLAESSVQSGEIRAIGIAYQMHGLVLVDREGECLRPAIIWCDSRAVPYGENAFKAIGEKECLHTLLNSPGNFTASKLAWVKENEPDIFAKIHKVLLPGDWLAMMLSGELCTTRTGLSEGIFWDFSKDEPSSKVLDHFGFNPDLLARTVDVFSEQGCLSSRAAEDTGLAERTPVTYRAGDQPNNALSLNVFEPGEIAATAGTSGVVYGVTDNKNYDPHSRVNRFLHVNDTAGQTRIGVLLCINGTGILNSWLRKTLEVSSFEEMNQLAASVESGAEGVSVLPFGNGSERMLCNRSTGAVVDGLDLLRHGRAHLCRAVQEGIVFAFRYGMDILRENGLEMKTIKAGDANMFKSPVFCQTLADISGCEIVLYETDGALGAARGAGIGAGIYKTIPEAFEQLACKRTYRPQPNGLCDEAYEKWKRVLAKYI